MASFDLQGLLAQAKEVTPSASQWFVPAEAPADDPFRPKQPPWVGVTLPQVQPLKPSPWLSTLYADLLHRLQQGFDLLDQAPDDQRPRYDRRLQQLSWQILLLQQLLRMLCPCHLTTCPNRIGGMPAGISPDDRDRQVWDLRQAHEAGLVAVKLTTPAGKEWRLVPWRSDPPAPGELSPQDMAALARVGALFGIDELTLLDRLQGMEVATS